MIVPASARAWRWIVAAVLISSVHGGCASSSPEQRSAPSSSIDARLCAAVGDAGRVGRHRIDIDGVERSYLLELPPGGSAGDGPVPLIISLHGHGGSAATFEATTGLAESAAARGFATVTPDALGSPSRWNFDHRPDGPDDGRFIDELIDPLADSG